MLSNGFDAPLILTLKPSRVLFYFQILVHGLAILAISLPSAIPFNIIAVIYILVIVSASQLICRYRRRLANRPGKFSWIKDAQWIEYSESEENPWQLGDGLLVTDWFVLIRLVNGKQSKSLLVFYDQCDTQSFRRLRVRLKFIQGDAAIPTDAS